MNTNTETTAAYRPSLAFYHANAKCTGCAANFELHPAHDAVDGYMFVRMANQMTLADRAANPPVYPRFDWDNEITFKLDVIEVARLVRVLRGEEESLEDGKGLFHISAEGSMRVCFRHMVEPLNCYSLEAYRRTKDGKEDNARIILATAEATALCLAFEMSIVPIAFGVPRVD